MFDLSCQSCRVRNNEIVDVVFGDDVRYVLSWLLLRCGLLCRLGFTRWVLVLRGERGLFRVNGRSNGVFLVSAPVFEYGLVGCAEVFDFKIVVGGYDITVGYNLVLRLLLVLLGAETLVVEINGAGLLHGLRVLLADPHLTGARLYFLGLRHQGRISRLLRVWLLSTRGSLAFGLRVFIKGGNNLGPFQALLKCRRRHLQMASDLLIRLVNTRFVVGALHCQLNLVSTALVDPLEQLRLLTRDHCLLPLWEGTCLGINERVP